MTAEKKLVQYSGEYLQLRRAMGHRLARHEQILSGFFAALAATGQDSITVDSAIRWACAPDGATPCWWAERLSAVRGLAEYIHSRDPDRAELIPPGAIAARTVRRVPYIYTDEQIRALISAASALHPTVRALTISTIIGLMAATGLRISECLAMNVADLDVGNNVLAVTGKRGRPRLVPIHPSTTAALVRYRRATTALIDGPDAQAFFLTFIGTRVHASSAEVAFRSLTDKLGYAAHPGTRRPRLHDMRHTFSTNALVRAHREGADVDATVSVLATYLGHVSPVSTYWYLTATPQLLELVQAKVVAAQRDGRLP